MTRHDDSHYRELEPQPSEVIAGWSETAHWPRRYIHTIGETIYAIVRAWRKGQTVRDLKKARSNLDWLIGQIEQPRFVPSPSGVRSTIVDRAKELMREEREQGGKRN